LAARVAKRLRREVTKRFGREVVSAGADYLDGLGWPKSKKARKPLDAFGNPIPWITYPAFEVLRRVVSPRQRVFEYGCGNSSLWWAAHAQEVISVEHDAGWAQQISETAPKNLRVLSRPLQSRETKSQLVQEFFVRSPDLALCGIKELDIDWAMQCEGFAGYASEIQNYPPFNVIVVDGMARCLCAWMAAHHLKEDGIIVFDNSDTWRFNAGYSLLSELGFGRIDFWGMGPVNTMPWCTSIFYRTTNWSKPLMTVSRSHKTPVDWIIETAKAQ
jgi:hypothetical protein